MISLRLLGSIGLRDEHGEPIDAVLRRPKLLALLAYLAIARPRGFHRRDKLVAMFWPESSQERARHALRQAIYALRRELGEEAIVTRGDEEVGVDESLVHTDVCELEAALEEGEHERSVRLYRGELLAGFHITDALEFERWLDEERSQYRTAANGVFGMLVDRAEASGDTASAVRWQRRLVTVSPYDEVAVRRLMEMLDRRGDRAGALVEYHALAGRLREHFDVEPAAATRALLTTICHDDGGRAMSLGVSQVEVASGTTMPASLSVKTDPSEGVAISSLESSSRSRRRKLLFGVLAAAATVGAIAVGLGHHVNTRGDARILDSNLVAVLPFRVSAYDTSYDYLREGAVDIFHTRLTGEGVPRAVDTRSLLRARAQLAGDEHRDLTLAESVELAMGFGAGHVLLGELVVGPSEITLSGRVMNVVRRQVVAEHSVSGSENELVLLDRLLGGLLASWAGEDRARLATLSDSLSAVKSWLAARREWRRFNSQVAIAHYKRAIEQDSSFALAWLGASEAALGGLRGYAQRAWVLRDQLSARDRAYLSAEGWIGPNYPAPSTYRELLAAADRAVEAAPDRPETWARLGQHLYTFGNYGSVDGALRRSAMALDSAVALDSTYLPAINLRLLVALRTRDSAAIQRYGVLHSAIDTTDQQGSVVLALGDTLRMSALRARFGEISGWGLGWFAGLSIFDGFPLADAGRAIEAREQRGEPSSFWQSLYANYRAVLALVGGNTSISAFLVDSLLGESNPVEAARVMIHQWLADPGYEDFARKAAKTLDSRAARADDANAVCYREMWRAHRGDTSATRQAIRQIEELAPDWGFFTVGPFGVCIKVLETMVEWSSGVPMRSPALDRLDSLMRLGPGSEMPYNVANLLIARWRARQGDYASALAATRRFPRAPIVGLWMLPLTPAYLREEGRLAALVGDTAEARRAYTHYLTLRENPDSVLEAQVDSVRAELMELREAEGEICDEPAPMTKAPSREARLTDCRRP